MFTCPYENYFSNSLRKDSNTAHIRVFNASPNTPIVDIYINNKPIALRLRYRYFSHYLSTAPGTYTITVFSSGQRISPLISTTVTISEKSIRTLAVTGTQPNLSLFPVPEPFFTQTPGKAYIRFVQLSPNTPNVDLSISTMGKVFKNIGYKGITDYIAINPGTYTFNLYSSQNGERILYVPNIRLIPNKIYTLYLVGLEGRNPPLQLLVPLDGNTYLRDI